MDIVVNKTVSMPLSLLQEIADEAEVMGKGFSETMATLVRIAIASRRQARTYMERDMEKEQKELKT